MEVPRIVAAGIHIDLPCARCGIGKAEENELVTGYGLNQFRGNKNLCIFQYKLYGIRIIDPGGQPLYDLAQRGFKTNRIDFRGRAP